MLQEFLSALNGITGDIFIEDKNGLIRIVDQLPFIVPTEQSLMNGMCILGTYYKRMQHFVDSYSSPLINKDVSGLYKVSLSYGVKIALEEYRNDLINIQRDLLMDQFLSVSYIKSKLNDYFLLFPNLWKILDCINEQNLRGGQILDIIFKNIPVGNYKIKSVLDKIISRCNLVFYRQLSSWILRGALFDPYNEFFIEAVPEVADKKPAADNKSQPILIDNMTKNEINALVYDSPERQKAKSFKINEKNIPCFVPISLVKKILFIGESVHFFDKNRQSVVVNDWTGSTENENRLKNELCAKFSDRLNELQSLNGFNLLRVQEVIEGVDKFILERMWSLLVEDHGFMEEYLAEVKDFLLLGRGELFMVFITAVETSLIGRPIGNSTERALNSEFVRASRAVLLDRDNLISKFRIVLNNTVSSEGGLRWDNIDLSYAVRWPFHIVLTPEALKHYNDLFRFLVVLKRTQMRLNSLFSIRRLRGTTNVRQWQLRNHMTFFINNLQYYIQVDVIESQISIFQRAVSTNHNIEALKATHKQIVHTMKSHAFLSNDTIQSGLIKICDVCIQFASLIELHSSSIDTADNTVNSRLKQLQERFHSLSTTLYNILSNVEGYSASNPHLRQLLVILDFNSFFSVLGAQIGSLKKSASSNVKKYTV